MSEVIVEEQEGTLNSDEARTTPTTSTTSTRLSRRPKTVSPDRAAIVAGDRKSAQLCIDNVSVSFDGFRALTDLTIVLDTGELRCIIGPNGAGKTTLMDVITGKTQPDRGAVFFLEDLEDLTQQTEHEIARRGIGRKFQRPTVFPAHSVEENVELALSAPKGVWGSLVQTLSGRQKETIAHTLERIGLIEHRGMLAGSLSHGQKQWLEIGMLIAQDPRVLLVDEPIAGMTHAEIEKTSQLLTELAGDHTVVVIEHDMDFVRSIATDVVTVLHEGKVLTEGPMERVQSDPKVIEVYLGE